MKGKHTDTQHNKALPWRGPGLGLQPDSPKQPKIFTATFLEWNVLVQFIWKHTHSFLCSLDFQAKDTVSC